MARFEWDDEKNKKLKRDRGISFEIVIGVIEEGNVVEDSAHANEKKYPNQRMMVVIIENYAYLVPYIDDNGTFVLKTVIPSRKATKRYLKKEAS